ncbi:purine nucleoside permease [Cerasicoccus maritimus]|uniref:purine nucleoside permease n=1 Tax=Cerasicoccus maritimus TaxID=490089 RepID=UPI002852AD3C|nr:purine nucleoside permease [Cerasicoccus maritimus]
MPVPVKAVLVTMFEPESGQAGELTPYRKAFGLEPFELPGSGLDHLFANHDHSLLAIVAGVGTANTAVSTMALGLCGQYDLSNAHWLISGIAGVNPNEASLGSVYWADWVVDGDLGHEVDLRSAPANWPIGIFPLGAKKPYGPSTLESGLFGRPYQRFQLNPDLLAWAMHETTALELANPPELQAEQKDFASFPKTTAAPCVEVGGSLSAARFWHGEHHNEWAEQWMRYWTDGQSRFVTSAMEDTGTLHAIAQLERMERARLDQTLVLRAGSNFTMPPPGKCAVQNLVGESEPNYPGMLAALENAGRVGGHILQQWLQ